MGTEFNRWIKRQRKKGLVPNTKSKGVKHVLKTNWLLAKPKSIMPKQ